MQQTIDRTKNYEFQKYNMSGVERIWFYRSSPHSTITHVYEVSPTATRNPGDAPQVGRSDQDSVRILKEREG